MEERIKITVEERLCTRLRKEWDDRKKKFAIARIAKAVVDECWNYVGSETRKRCVVTILPADGDAFATLESHGVNDAWSIDIPVAVVGAWMARAIPHVGCDPDVVAKALARRMWASYQFDAIKRAGEASIAKPATPQVPLSLFDYCNETVPARCATVR